MAILEVLRYPDERLQRIAVPVTAFDQGLARLCADLEETLRAHPGCVGIAAPQVGVSLRVALVDVSGRPDTPHNGLLRLVNPRLLGQDGEVLGREGCLSVPDYTGNVVRPASIHLAACDPAGRPGEYRSAGYEARAILHELDHLDGLLFLDRVVNPRSDLFRRKKYQT